MSIFNRSEPIWKFWNPLSGFGGGLICGAVMIAAVLIVVQIIRKL